MFDPARELKELLATPKESWKENENAYNNPLHTQHTPLHNETMIIIIQCLTIALFR